MKNFTQSTKKNFYIVTWMFMIVTAIVFFLAKPKHEFQDNQNAEASAAGLLQSSDLLMDNPLILVLTTELWAADLADHTKISEEK